MRKQLCILFLLWSFAFTALAQDKWGLRRCVEYAVNNNISIKQADVQARLTALTLKQYRLSQIPTLSFNASGGYSAGRNQDPTTFSLITQGYFFNQYSIQAGVNLFNFGSLQRAIEGGRLALDAANANTDRVRNDISLQVANAYLQVLLYDATASTAALQLKYSQSQLDITRKQVEAGALPELNAAELQSQVAQDSSQLITARSNAQQAIISLKAYMGLDAGVPFDVDIPPVETIPVDKISDLQPDNVYQLAIVNQPLQKSDALQIKSAAKFVQANRAAMYPTVSLFGSLGSSYTNQALQVTGTSIIQNAPIGSVTVGGTPYVVTSNQDFTIPNYRKQPYFSQLDQNFRQTIGLQISIPILNSGTLRTSYERSKLNMKGYELQQEQDNLTLKSNIYQAYNLAIAALEKFEANKVTVTATQKSFEFAQKRYNIGMLNTIDLLTNQNNFFKAKNDLLYSQFDYVFKMKVLEFYKGQGIKL